MMFKTFYRLLANIQTSPFASVRLLLVEIGRAEFFCSRIPMKKCANLKREMKIRRRLFTFSMKSELIRLFHVLFVQWRQRNVPNKSATRVNLLVLDCFLDLFVAFAVVISETGRFETKISITSS